MKCHLCGKTKGETTEWLDSSDGTMLVGWFSSPNDRDYCPLCMKYRFDEIEKIEEK